MVIGRDKHLLMGVRKLNLLRLERHKRLLFTNSLAQKFTILALLKDDSFSDLPRILAKFRHLRIGR